jgi:Uma2 family endonuclease
MTATVPLDTSPHPAKLSAREFWLLADAGAFAEFVRTELIEGEIFVVNAQFRRHATARRKLVRCLEDSLAGHQDGLGVVDECSVVLGEASIPQPDITVTTEPDGDGPVPLASVRLIVEIADSTLEQDLGRKQRLYADYGVPEYWVADLAANRLVRMWMPQAEGYACHDELPFGRRVESATIAGLAVDTADLR